MDNLKITKLRELLKKTTNPVLINKLQSALTKLEQVEQAGNDITRNDAVCELLEDNTILRKSSGEILYNIAGIAGFQLDIAGYLNPTYINTSTGLNLRSGIFAGKTRIIGYPNPIGNNSSLITPKDCGSLLTTNGFEGELSNIIVSDKYGSLIPNVRVLNDGGEKNSSEYSIEVTEGSYPGEVSWTITNEAEEVLVSGGAPYNGEQELPPGDYTINMNDSYGDGWNGSVMSITGNLKTGDELICTSDITVFTPSPTADWYSQTATFSTKCCDSPLENTLNGKNVDWVVTQTGENHTIIMQGEQEIASKGFVGIFVENAATYQCIGYTEISTGIMQIAVMGPILDEFIWIVNNCESETPLAIFNPKYKWDSPNSYERNGVSIMLGGSFVSPETITISSGISLFSTQSHRVTSSIESLLGDDLSEVLIVKDFEGKMFIPGVLNQIGNIEPGRAYQIHLKNGANLNITGKLSTEIISLTEGWNMIRYRGNVTTVADFKDLHPNITNVYSVLNVAINMVTNTSYLVKTSTAFTLEF